jgi:putative nucleotidyltransferase with HDIG domain
MAIALDDVIKKIQDLPSLSAVVVELLSSMANEQMDLHKLAEKIMMDQSLTAKTLRLANSSFYGMQSKVTTIPKAISVLGFHSVRTLATACSVMGSFASNSASGFDFPAFWRHSVATAVCAKILARPLRQSSDTAFTAGLLHDIGTLVLATRFPTEYSQMVAYRKEHDCFVIDAERAVFGIDHALVGSALAAYWRFPVSIQTAVANHHELTDEKTVSMEMVIHVANTIAHALDLAGDDDELVPTISDDVWTALSLSDAAYLQVFRDTEREFTEMCQVLIN